MKLILVIALLLTFSLTGGKILLKDLYDATFNHTFTQEDLLECNKTLSASCVGYPYVSCSFSCRVPVNMSLPGAAPISLNGRPQRTFENNFWNCGSFAPGLTMSFGEWVISDNNLMQKISRRQVMGCMKRFIGHTKSWNMVIGVLSRANNLDSPNI